MNKVSTKDDRQRSERNNARINMKNLVDIFCLPIYYNNVRGVTSKYNMCMKIDLSMYKVLVLTETWLSKREFSSVYFPAKFKVYRYDRIVPNSLRRYGGVAILVHQELHHVRLKLKENDKVEFVAVEIRLNPISLVIYAVYMRIFDPEVAQRHIENIKELSKRFSQHRIMVVGDFNMNSIRWQYDENGKYFQPTDVDTSKENFLKEMHDLSFFQLSNFRNKSENVLDLVFVNELGDVEMAIDQSRIISTIQQDVAHVPYEISFEYHKPGTSLNVIEKEVICYKIGNYERIMGELDQIKFADEFNSRDVESSFDFFYSTINRLVASNIPKKRITVNLNKPAWWTRKLQSLKNRRDKLFKRDRRGPEYAAVLKEFDDMTSKLFEQYIDDVQDEIKNDPAEFWKFAKLNNKASTYPSTMYFKDNIGQTTEEIVGLFADFFEENYVVDEQQWTFEDVYKEPENPKEVDISCEDIELAIHSLKWKGGVGADQVSPFFIKKCIGAMSSPLWLLWQKTVEMKQIPKKTKLSRVVPVFKKGKKKNIENYRVVVIISSILKIFQRAIKLQLTIIMEPYVHNSQHGFRPKRSVTTNLLSQSVVVYEAFERGLQLDTFLGDFEKAFERVCHRLFIGKLHKFSIGPKTARWLFENIRQFRYYVQIGEIKSREYESTSGIVPGSILGPQMFTMFINDVAEVVMHAFVLLFADDIKASMRIQYVTDSLKLQSDINRIYEWSIANRLFFNADKCAIFTACRASTSVETSYKLGDEVIKRKDEVWDLGLLVDRKYTLAHHREQMTISARQMVGYIKRKSNGKFKTETLKLLYSAYVRSRLEFASVIWNPHQEVYIDDIESVQKQFLIDLLDSRSNASSYRLAPYEKRCKTVNLQPLLVRRKVTDALCAYDIYHKKVNDVFLNSKFLKSRSVRQLRFNRLLEERFFNVDYLIYQPLSRLTMLINEFSELVVNSRSRVEFKSRITVMLSRIPDDVNV